MKSIILFSLLLISSFAKAGTIIIDPDDYAHGTDLTNISKYTHIKSTNGSPVHATLLSEDAADRHDTKGLGRHVFGSEWLYSPYYDAPGLEITFNVPVVSFSLLIAELFPDAGPGSDPVIAYVYNTKNELISEQYVSESYKRVELGLIKGLEELNIYWAYWTFEFSAANIGKIVIGGDSEPTTFDRLEFTYLELPEPSSLFLYLGGLSLLLLCRKHKGQTHVTLSPYPIQCNA